MRNNDARTGVDEPLHVLAVALSAVDDGVRERFRQTAERVGDLSDLART